MGRKIRQLYFSFCFDWIIFLTGYDIGLTAQQVPELALEHKGLSANSLSWITSLVYMFAIPGSLGGGVLANKIGRRTCGLIICPLYACGYLLNFLSTPDRIWLIYAGRIINGFSLGMQPSICYPYFGEITDSHLSATVASSSGCFVVLGVLMPLIMGGFGIPWKITSLIGAIVPMLIWIMVYFCPESPTWLVSKGEFERAEVALLRLRGGDQPIAAELKDLKASTVTQVHEEPPSFRKMMSRFCDGDVWKPLLIVIVTQMLQTWTGTEILNRYVVVIFKASGSSLGVYMSSILVHAVKMLGRFFGSLLLVRYKSKRVLTVSCLFSSIGLLGLGLSIILNPESKNLFPTDKEHRNGEILPESAPVNNITVTNYDSHLSPPTIGFNQRNDGWLTEILTYLTPFLHYAPLACCCLYNFTNGLGFGPLCWVYASILFPDDLRSQLCGISVAILFSVSFLQTKTYPELSQVLSVGGTFILFGVVALVAIIWGICVIPEIKGKSSHQLSQIFLGKNSQDKDVLASERETPTLSLSQEI